MADFPGGVRHRPTAVVAGDRILHISGQRWVGGGPSAEVWAFKPTGEGVWELLGEFPGSARIGNPVAFSIGDTAYYGTGKSVIGTHYDDLWRYVPETDNWEEMTGMKDGGRGFAVAFSLNGKGYIGGGRGPGRERFDFRRYDPGTDAWTRIENFPVERRNMVAFTVGGYAYVGGGSSPYSNDVASRFYRYDPEADKWARMPDFPGTLRRDAVAFSINGKGYVGLGWNGGDHFNDLYVFDPEEGNWRPSKPLPGKGRRGAGWVTYQGRGYVFNGTQRRNVLTREVWEFVPDLP